jgi:hypothetical protein
MSHRQDICFPFKAPELLIAINEKIETIARRYDEQVDEQIRKEEEAQTYREDMRTLGVKNWEKAVDPNLTSPIPARTRLDDIKRLAQLGSLKTWRMLFQRSLEEDPHRMFKISLADAEFFGL